MRIALILKDNINRRPPILSVAHQLLDLIGRDLTLIVTGVLPETLALFEERGARVFICQPPATHFLHVHAVEATLAWTSFRYQVGRILRENQFDYLWCGSADAALALGNSLLKHRFILQVQELYDAVPAYRRRLASFMRAATHVIVPEETRAHVFRAWYKLSSTPTVLPNKPYAHPRKRNIPISHPKIAEVFSTIPAETHVVFYQGILKPERDLRPVIRAVEEMGKGWVFMVQGMGAKGEYYKKLRQDHSFLEIPTMPAPYHLAVTSRVFCGLVTYTHQDLNCEFCAPNKIYEYAGFGLPMLANDVLGLRRTVEENKMGICCNFDTMTVHEIQDALHMLSANYGVYSANASHFFESCDNEATLRAVLAKL